MFKISHDDWYEQAECAKRSDEVFALNKSLTEEHGVDYDIFYPPTGHSQSSLKYSNLFCKSCPVVSECLSASQANFEQGTWGGKSFIQRRNLERIQRRSLLALQKRMQALSLGGNKSNNEETNHDLAS